MQLNFTSAMPASDSRGGFDRKCGAVFQLPHNGEHYCHLVGKRAHYWAVVGKSQRISSAKA